MVEKINIGDLVYYKTEPNALGVVIAKEEKGDRNINGWCKVYWQDYEECFGIPEHHLRKAKKRK